MSENKPIDVVDICKFISTTHRTEFDRRRKYEWKVVLTALTFFVLITAAVMKGELIGLAGKPILLMIYAAILCAVALFSCKYLQDLHQANQRNKGLAEEAENQLIAYAKGTLPVNQKGKLSSEINRKHNWSLKWQVIIISAVALMSVAAVASPFVM